MDNNFDVAVVGGGVIGLASAYYLGKAKQRVVIIEGKEFGAGASGACDEMILLQSKKPGVVLELALESLEIYKTLPDELGIDIEFHNRGGMILIENTEQLAIMEKFVNGQRACGLDVRLIDRAQVIKLHPHVNPGIIASTYSPIDSQVSPLKLMLGFIKKVREQGACIRKGAPVTHIERLGTRWKLTTSDEAAFFADAVVDAAGAWAPDVARLVDIDLPIKPKRGQIAVTEKVPELGTPNVWDADYMVSKLNPEAAAHRPKAVSELGIGLSLTRTPDGNYFIGSTREFAGFDKSTTPQGIKHMVYNALKFFPVLKNVHIIRSFAGLRPATPDGKPILGELPGRERFFIAAGHEGDGIALAPVTGRIIARMVTGEPLPAREQNELGPGRFCENVS